MQRNQQGFTLIELVIVIVILGILSAFALPRFADLGGDARAASIEGAAGAMRSASSIVRSACLASSDCDADAATASITLEGENINLAYGYPQASTDVDDGILAAAQISGDDYDLSDSDGFDLSVAIDDTSHSETGDACRIGYDQATEDSAPTFDVNVEDC